MNEEISKNILKSGTSLVGIVCKDGVVMAADKRTTAGGQLIMNKQSKKIRRVNDSIIASYTGSVADIELGHKILKAELRLKELKTKSKVTVREAANLLGIETYKNIRSPSMMMSIVGTLVAGVDEDGKCSLFSVEPAGGVYEIKDYDANFSSGMPFILGLLEREYKKDLTVKDGIALARDCIKAAIERDPGSGNGVDVFSVTKEGVKHVIAEEIIPQYK